MAASDNLSPAQFAASDALGSMAYLQMNHTPEQVKATVDAITSTSLGGLKPPSEAMQARAQGKVDE